MERKQGWKGNMSGGSGREIEEDVYKAYALYTMMELSKNKK